MSMPFRRHKCSNMCQNSCQIIIRSRINWTDLLFGSDCTCFGFYFVSVFSFSVFPCYSMFFECLIFISQILGNWPPHWTTDLQHVLPFFANFWLEFNVEQRHRTINPLRDCFKIRGKMFDRKCQKKRRIGRRNRPGKVCCKRAPQDVFQTEMLENWLQGTSYGTGSQKRQLFPKLCHNHENHIPLFIFYFIRTFDKHTNTCRSLRACPTK